MHPVLDFGPWEVSTYTAVLVPAMVIGALLLWHEAGSAGFQRSRVVAFCTGAVVAGLVGGRINAWLFYRSGQTLGDLTAGSFFENLTSFGSLVGALTFAWLYARRRGWSMWAFLDLLAPIIPLVEGLMRWGCLLNGCCYGRETNAIWGSFLPDATGHWAIRHPTQVILSAWSLALFAWFWRRRRRRAFDGVLILSYLVVYHVGRFGIDALRADGVVVAGALTSHQVASVIFAILAAVAMLRIGSRSEEPHPAHRGSSSEAEEPPRG